jgi:hypothetical protein
VVTLAAAVDEVAVVVDVVVVVSRDGAVGVICDDVVDVEPLASAPAGMASVAPIHVMAAANLSDFTSPENVVERGF